jgi:hypothetical protein
MKLRGVCMSGAALWSGFNRRRLSGFPFFDCPQPLSRTHIPRKRARLGSYVSKHHADVNICVPSNCNYCFCVNRADTPRQKRGRPFVQCAPRRHSAVCRPHATIVERLSEKANRTSPAYCDLLRTHWTWCVEHIKRGGEGLALATIVTTDRWTRMMFALYTLSMLLHIIVACARARPPAMLRTSSRRVRQLADRGVHSAPGPKTLAPGQAPRFANANVSRAY